MEYNVSGIEEMYLAHRKVKNRFMVTKLNNHSKPLPSQYGNANHLELADTYEIQDTAFEIEETADSDAE